MTIISLFSGAGGLDFYLLCGNTYKVMRKILFSHLVTTVMNTRIGRYEHRFLPIHYEF